MIVVHPLFSGAKESSDNKPQTHRKRKRPFGVFIVEQIEDNQLTEQTRKRIDIVAEHAGSALGNALEHHSIFLLPLWKLLGKSKKLVSNEMLPKTITVTVLMTALIAALLFLPWKFQMHCTGMLQPVFRQRIYAPLDAEIKHLFVDHNTPVVGPTEDYRGTPLVELRSRALEDLGVQLDGEQEAILATLVSLRRQLQDPDRQLKDHERAELVGQEDRAKVQLVTVQHKLHLYKQLQLPDLVITSPMNGVVVSLDVKRRLTEKLPISRMQYVMEIADLEGPWQLELLMPEKRMGHIVEQQRQHPESPLRVEFKLASNPSATYYGTVTEIHNRAEVRSDSGSAGGMTSNLNTVAIKVAPDDLSLLPPESRPGTECSARIDCGTRPLGYVLFYEVIAFVQKNVLFRWF
jgi:hypothetical protein